MLTLTLTLNANHDVEVKRMVKHVHSNQSLNHIMKRFAADESGATAVEYGIIIAILSLAIIGSGDTVWKIIKDKFIFIGNTITTGGT